MCLSSIAQQFENSKTFFKTHKTKDIKFRKQQLKQLSKSIKNHENELLEALKEDLERVLLKLTLLKLVFY